VALPPRESTTLIANHILAILAQISNQKSAVNPYFSSIYKKSHWKMPMLRFDSLEASAKRYRPNPTIRLSK